MGRNFRLQAPYLASWPALAELTSVVAGPDAKKPAEAGFRADLSPDR
jgi:hypothetical protein